MRILSIINSVYFWTFLIVCFGILVATESLAQHTGFAVSGQGRGGQGDARQAAQIDQLESENAEREVETSQNAAGIADHETRITNNENEIATIQLHAKQSQQNCTAGELIQWNGSLYSCVPEADPLLGEHGKASKPPPDCHDVNAKLLWNAAAKQWHCEVDNGGISDPPICSGPGEALQWDGSNWICNQNLAGVMSYGGSFQKHGFSGGAQNSCDKPNPATGGCSCPSGYTARMAYLSWHDCGGSCYTSLWMCEASN